MNLVINASEAIGDQAGVIAISTGCLVCDLAYLKEVWGDEGLAAGNYVSLEVSDSGCGMDAETVDKIFDPFFTTKFTGRGLGMAAVLGIVRGHKGAIRVYSEPGKGTCFKLLFPASGRPETLAAGEAPDVAWRGGGRVLLVDDEEAVLATGGKMLRELGFEVLTACDGEMAVEVFTSCKDIKFVVLDLTMPRMDGEQCFRALRALDPGVRVILSSGYNEQDVTPRFSGRGLDGFIQKPYKLSELKGVIRNMETQSDPDPPGPTEPRSR
jgi:two-component system, cell cycle sensor histidine kinase and response regulator CckA